MDPRRQAICRYRTQIWPVRYTCTSTWGGPSLVVQGGQRRRSRSRHAGDRAVLAQAPRVAATAVRVWRRGPSSLGLSGDAERPALGRGGGGEMTAAPCWCLSRGGGGTHSSQATHVTFPYRRHSVLPPAVAVAAGMYIHMYLQSLPQSSG